MSFSCLITSHETRLVSHGLEENKTESLMIAHPWPGHQSLPLLLPRSGALSRETGWLLVQAWPEALFSLYTSHVHGFKGPITLAAWPGLALALGSHMPLPTCYMDVPKGPQSQQVPDETCDLVLSQPPNQPTHTQPGPLPEKTALMCYPQCPVCVCHITSAQTPRLKASGPTTQN